ncbi:hypothetical protein B0H19DRAFT_668547 [Mycena capillaripes]|nr:hypothetical protein B0H19DRAFT_668547 [Mycena capillaripes]
MSKLCSVAGSESPAPPPRGSKRESTSRVAKPMATTDFHNNLLKEARKILADSDPQVLEVPFTEFVETRLPRVDANSLATVMEKLAEKPNGGITASKGVMHGYANMTPGQHTGHKTAAFDSFCRFISLVVALGLEQDGAEAWVGHYSKQTPVNTERIHSSRPDSYLYLIEGIEAIGWHQLLTISEFKKKKQDQLEVRIIYICRGNNNLLLTLNQNWIQLLWGCNHILRNDPRRRFTFGLTVEDDEARLWFFSRACIVVSEPFSFIQEPQTLVHFLLSMVLSPHPPSSNDVRAEAPTPQHLQHLGFDPTMTRVDINGNIGYEIQMAEECYILTKVLCDYKVDELIGRATRVWQVAKKEDRTQEFVMKDIWLEQGARREGDILDEINDRLNGTRPDLLEAFRRHFLAVEKEATIGEPIRGVDAHSDVKYLSLVDLFPTSQSTSIVSPSLRTYSTGILAPRRFADREQYRVFFRGVLTPLHLLRNAREQAQVIADLPLALEVLLAAGCVHRDLSNTNAMLNPTTGRGVLTDVEYSVPYGQEIQGT